MNCILKFITFTLEVKRRLWSASHPETVVQRSLGSSALSPYCHFWRLDSRRIGGSMLAVQPCHSMGFFILYRDCCKTVSYFESKRGFRKATLLYDRNKKRGTPSPLVQGSPFFISELLFLSGQSCLSFLGRRHLCSSSCQSFLRKC